MRGKRIRHWPEGRRFFDEHGYPQRVTLDRRSTTFDCDGCGKSWAVYHGPDDAPEIIGCPHCGRSLADSED